MQGRLLQLYSSGRLTLDELVTHTYALEDVNSGYADMWGGKNLRGVISF
jgi:S-(hydroxymethyl)glutathione dehydrogenase / alcohol dehydrogenase